MTLGILAIAPTALIGAFGDGDVERLPPDAAKAYAAIKPSAMELKFRRIPWLIDLNEGIETAKAEGRPLLIWTGQQSHPLERC